MREKAIQATVLLLRVVTAFLFIQVGGLKLFGWFGGMPPNHTSAEPMTLYWFAGVLEVFGGTLIMAGLFTRPLAFMLSGEMAVAYFMGHFEKKPTFSPWPVVNLGMPAVLMCFIFLFFAAYGPGDWSLDALMSRARGDRVPGPG